MLEVGDLFFQDYGNFEETQYGYAVREVHRVSSRCAYFYASLKQSKIARNAIVEKYSSEGHKRRSNRVLNLRLWGNLRKLPASANWGVIKNLSVQEREELLTAIAQVKSLLERIHETSPD